MWNLFICLIHVWTTESCNSPDLQFSSRVGKVRELIKWTFPGYCTILERNTITILRNCTYRERLHCGGLQLPVTNTKRAERTRLISLLRSFLAWSAYTGEKRLLKSQKAESSTDNWESQTLSAAFFFFPESHQKRKTTPISNDWKLVIIVATLCIFLKQLQLYKLPLKRARIKILLHKSDITRGRAKYFPAHCLVCSG